MRINDTYSVDIVSMKQQRNDDPGRRRKVHRHAARATTIAATSAAVQENESEILQGRSRAEIEREQIRQMCCDKCNPRNLLFEGALSTPRKRLSALVASLLLAWVIYYVVIPSYVYGQSRPCPHTLAQCVSPHLVRDGGGLIIRTAVRRRVVVNQLCYVPVR